IALAEDSHQTLSVEHGNRADLALAHETNGSVDGRQPVDDDGLAVANNRLDRFHGAASISALSKFYASGNAAGATSAVEVEACARLAGWACGPCFALACGSISCRSPPGCCWPSARFCPGWSSGAPRSQGFPTSWRSGSPGSAHWPRSWQRSV